MFTQGVNDAGEFIRDVYVIHQPCDLTCPPEEGMTRQEFAKDCDINAILARYETTGAMDHFNMRDPLYMDVSNVPDLATAIQYLELAQEAFMRLPAVTRREFDNDPVKFVQFAENPENLPRMREWGLAAPQKAADAPTATPGMVPSPETQNAPAASSTSSKPTGT